MKSFDLFLLDYSDVKAMEHLVFWAILASSSKNNVLDLFSNSKYQN